MCFVDYWLNYICISRCTVEANGQFDAWSPAVSRVPWPDQTCSDFRGGDVVWLYF